MILTVSSFNARFDLRNVKISSAWLGCDADWVITHVVLFNFHDPNDAFEARRRVDDLRGRIPQIRSLSTGVDAGRSNSPWQLALVSSHDDWDALDAYRAHPAHVEFLDWSNPLVVQKAAVDYES